MGPPNTPSIFFKTAFLATSEEWGSLFDKISKQAFPTKTHLSPKEVWMFWRWYMIPFWNLHEKWGSIMGIVKLIIAVLISYRATQFWAYVRVWAFHYWRFIAKMWYKQMPVPPDSEQLLSWIFSWVLRVPIQYFNGTNLSKTFIFKPKIV